MKTLQVLLLSTFFIHCQPDPAELFEEARGALKEEKPEKAKKLMEVAYDLSLPDDMHALNQSLRFDNGVISADRSTLTLVENKPDSIKLHYFNVSQFPATEKYKFSIPAAELLNIYSSPSGSFSVLKFKGKDNLCDLAVYSTTAETLLEITDHKTSCSDDASIDDSGNLFFVSEQSLYSWNHETNTAQVLEYGNLKIKKNNKSSLQINKKNEVFFTHGNAGVYDIYLIKDKALKIKSDISSGNLIFDLNGNPTVVMGGAGNYYLLRLNTSKPNESKKVAQKVRFDKMSYVSANKFIFMEYGLLFLSGNSQKKELKFWAKDFFVAADETIYLLSRSGMVLRYTETIVTELSSQIFREGAVLYEGG